MRFLICVVVFVVLFGLVGCSDDSSCNIVFVGTVIGSTTVMGIFDVGTSGVVGDMIGSTGSIDDVSSGTDGGAGGDTM